MTTTPGAPERPEIRLGSSTRRNLGYGAAGVIVVAAIVIGIVLKATGGNSAAGTVAGSHFGNDLQIAYEADSASEKAFLEYLNTTIAPKYGVTITPVPIGDGNQLDQATADGTYIANIYQHIHWLNEVVAQTHWKLSALGPVFQWAYSVYSAKHKSLDELPHGARIALLNDPANTAQALWLLQRAGKITFKPGVNPWAAKVSDIATNPAGYQFTFIDYGAGPRTLPDVDAVIAYNMQFISAGVAETDKIYAPAAPKDFAGQLVVGSDYLGDPQVAVLKRIFFDPAVQRYLATTTDPALKDQLSPVSRS